jgi:hypothetical protein
MAMWSRLDLGEVPVSSWSVADGGLIRIERSTSSEPDPNQTCKEGVPLQCAGEGRELHDEWVPVFDKCLKLARSHGKRAERMRYFSP